MKVLLKLIYKLFIPLVFWVVLSSCFNDDVSWGIEVTEDRGDLPAGLIINEEGAPVSFVNVKIRSAKFLMDTSWKSEKRVVKELDWITDLRGYFPLDVMDPGDYIIEAQDGNGQGSVAFFRSLPLENRLSIDTVKMVLHPNKTVVGRVAPLDSNSGQVYIRPFGIEKVARADSTGWFTIEMLAMGNYTFHVTSSSDGFEPVDMDFVLDSSSDTVFTDTLWLN